MSTELTDADREVLLQPCACGHSINDHGSLVACWRCEDDGGECAVTFEALLVERMGVIVAGRVREPCACGPGVDVSGEQGSSGPESHGCNSSAADRATALPFVNTTGKASA